MELLAATEESHQISQLFLVDPLFPKYMFNSNQVMIDPSLLVTSNADKFISRWNFSPSTDFDLYISQSFQDLVRESDSYAEDPTFSYFIGNLSTENVTDYTKLERIVLESEEYTAFNPDDIEDYQLEADYQTIQTKFMEEFPKSQKGALANVLYDEFVFLFERSWIPARFKKPLNDIVDIDSGIRNIDFDREAVDELTTNARDETLTRLRVLKQKNRWRWIALGGEAGAVLDYDNSLVRAMLAIGVAHEMVCLRFDP